MIRCFALAVTIILAVAFSTPAFAQLTGTKAIPGDYATVLAAVTDLNTQGVGAGGVTFNVAAGYSETAPTGGFAITAQGTAVNQIIFQKVVGAASTFTAPVGQTAGNLNDGVFKLIGADYVTLDGFTLLENPANIITVAGTNDMTEWGVALLYADTANGAQNNTIKNCTITLNRTYQNTFGIYSNSTHSATAVTTSLSGTTTAGSNSNLKIYTNAISNVNIGIVVVGPTAAAAQNDGLDVGGAGAPTGNSITNYGTTGTFSGYANVSGTVNGILVRNTKNFNVSYNTVTSSVGGTTVGTLRGIYVPTFSTAPTGTYTNTINNNSISLQSAVAAGAMLGIAIEVTTTTVTSTTNVNSNNFHSTTHTIAASGAITFISHVGSATAGPLNHSISNNTFTNLSVNTTGSVTFITNSWARPTDGVGNINNNSIVTAFAKTGAGGTVTLYTSNSTSGATVSEINTGNNFSNITVTGATTVAGWGTTDGGSPNKTVQNNTFSNWTGGTSAITGLAVSFSGSANVQNNTVSNISSAGAITGIASTSGTQNIYQNTVNGLSTTGASAVTGISVSGGTTQNAYKNKIYDLQSNNATGTVNGILISAGTTVSAYNNLIGDLRAPSTSSATDAIRGINISAATALANRNIYYNSIYINATSTGANFSTSGVFHTFSSTATSGTLDMRNNVIVNTSTATGTGVTSAFRRSAATDLNNYATTSNNNLFYAGTPSATNLIFTDGTNSDQTLGAFKARVSPREASSISENPAFVSTVGANPNFLHINTATPTQIESGGAAVAGITDDYDGNTRNATTPDIGADEFAGIGVDLTAPSISYVPLGNTGSVTARTLTATITDASGVPTAGIGLPRLFWKRNSGSYAAVTATSLGSNQYSFALGSGVAAGDTVSYYIVAQDGASTPNVGAQPSGGAGGFTANPPTAATPPTTPSSYFVVGPPLSGDYTVGTALFNSISGRNIVFEPRIRKVTREVLEPEPSVASVERQGNKSQPELPASDKIVWRSVVKEVEVTEWIPMENGKAYDGPLSAYGANSLAVYPTITAAVNDLNLRGVGGPVRLLLTDATYPTETFPITVSIANDSVPTAAKSVTIKPNTGVTASVSGAASATVIFKVLSNYVTIDGSNTNGGVTRNLTIENTSVTTPSVVWFGSIGTTPITNGTLKNCIIRNGVNTSSAVAITDGTTLGNAGYFSNMTVQNNSIQKAYIGVYSQGGTIPQNGSNLTYTQNDINSADANAIRLVPLYMQGVNGATVTQNNLGNTDSTAGENDIGIWLASGTINATVSNNTISNLIYSGTGAFSPIGINVTPGVASANNLISRNNISNLRSGGSSSTALVMGISVTGTSGAITIERNNVQDIRNVNPATWPSVGINLNGGNGNIVRNNFVANVSDDQTAGTGAFTPQFGATGIRVNAGTDHQVQYNTVHHYGAMSGIVSTNLVAGIAVFATTSTGVDIRNNILSNKMTGGNPTGTRFVDFYLPSGATSALNLTNNNNAYFEGTDANSRLAQVGTTFGVGEYSAANFNPDSTTPATNFRAYTSGLSAAGTNDNASLATSTAPPFISNSNLHIDSTQSPIVSNEGTPIAGVTTDFDGQARNATTPDIGADEFSLPTSGISGNLNVGTAQPYANLREVFAFINAGQVTGNVSINIMSNITETDTATLNSVNYLGGPFTITVRPVGGAWTDTASINGPMVNLNGADNVVFDGNISGVKSLTLRNTSATATSSTIRFINDATNNTVMNCVLQGAGTSVTTGGVITFSTSTGSVGNSTNTISNNDIRDLSTSGLRPAAGIASNGTAAASNRSNTISNNNIYNFLTNGINVSGTGNGGPWTISGNSFYYNNATVPVAAQTAINFNPGVGSGGSNLIYRNYIGGQAPLAGGSPWTNSGNVQVAGVFVTVDSLATSTVRRNTITNIVKSGTGAGGVFPFALLNGKLVVDSNTVGNPTILAMSSYASGNQVSGSLPVQPEAIGNGNLPDVQPQDHIAHVTPAEVQTNAGTSNPAPLSWLTGGSIGIVNAGTGITTGIQNQSAFNVIIKHNTIANLMNTGIGSVSGARGINNGGTPTSTTSIIENVVHDISSYTTGAITTPAAGGITWFPSGFTPVAGNDVTANTCYALSGLDSGAVASNVMGMLITNNTATFTRNLVYGLRNASTGTTATLPPTATGFYMRAQSAPVIANNMASVGSGQNTNTVFAAFWNGSGTLNTGFLYHNSGLVTGTAASGSLGSWAFLRGNHTTTSVFTNWTVRNNIFVNSRTGGSGSHYAIGNQGTRPDSMWTATTSDFNVFNSANASTIGLWGTTDQTLAQWQATTGGDAATQAGNPGFIGATNLHISPSSTLPSNNGTPLAAVTNDFDGETRSATTPDRGADEYVAGQTGPLLFENFESGVFPPAGWATYVVAGDSGWRSSTVAPFSGATHAFNRYNSPGTLGSKFLVTKRVNIPSAANTYEVTFWARRQFTSAFPPDTVYVKISTTDSLPASFTQTIYKCYTGALADTATNPNIYGLNYRKFKATFTGISGQLFVAFDHQDNDGQTIYLDDVTLQETQATHDIGVQSVASAALRPASILGQGTMQTGRETTNEKELDETTLSSRQSLEILSLPESFNSSDAISFSARVANFGQFVENSYQVGWTIDGVPQTAVSNTRPLAIGGTDTLTLTWATQTPGQHVLRAFTILATDLNRSNDTATYNFSVSPPDIVFEQGFNNTIPPYPTGWHVKNRDGGGTTTYFQGNPTVFPAFEGSGYIGANYEAANGLLIDEWLVTPNTGGLSANPTAAVDSLIFWQRAPSGQVPPNFFPDSLQIRVSTTDTAVASFTMVLDYFRVDTIGWRRKAYALPNAANRYIAFRYLIFNGGLTGSNSNYIGIDAVQIKRTAGPTPGWTAQTSGTTAFLQSVRQVNADVIWAAGNGSTVRRSTDGGATWTNGNPNPGVITGDIYSIEALNANTAFVTTSPAATFIYRTTNGGALWAQVFTQTGGFINAIRMVSPTVGIAEGDPVGGTFTIVGTTDGGATWARVPAANEPVPVGAETGINNSLTTVGTTHIWFGSSLGPVWRSTNSGTSWTRVATTFTTNNLEVHFNNTLNGVTGSTAAASRTTDGGTTWVATTVPGTGNLNGLSGAGYEFFASKGANVYRSTDRGATWAVSYTGTIGTLSHLDFFATGTTSTASFYGTAISQTGGIATAFLNLVTGVRETASELPTVFSLAQNYPNPFNPTTTIRYALPEASRVNLSIYNMLGQRVAELTNAEESAGFYNVVWNGRNQNGAQVATGVYFYRIEATPVNGGAPFISLKKALLLK